jgi:hypothetical protein
MSIIELNTKRHQVDVTFTQLAMQLVYGKTKNHCYWTVFSNSFRFGTQRALLPSP